MWRRNSPFFCCYDGNVKLYYAFHPICLTCPVRLCDVINALGHFAVILWIWNSALGSILHVPDLFIFHFPDKWVCPVLNTIYLWSSCPNDWWLLLQSIDRNAMTGRTLLLIKIKGQFRHLVRSTWSCSVMDLPHCVGRSIQTDCRTSTKLTHTTKSDADVYLATTSCDSLKVRRAGELIKRLVMQFCNWKRELQKPLIMMVRNHTLS